MGVNLSHLSLNRKGDNNIFHTLSYFQEPKRCIRRINPNPYSQWETGFSMRVRIRVDTTESRNE